VRLSARIGQPRETAPWTSVSKDHVLGLIAERRRAAGFLLLIHTGLGGIAAQTLQSGMDHVGVLCPVQGHPFGIDHRSGASVLDDLHLPSHSGFPDMEPNIGLQTVRLVISHRFGAILMGHAMPEASLPILVPDRHSQRLDKMPIPVEMLAWLETMI